MKPVFFYGLFMDQELLINNGYHPSQMNVCCLKNYQLKIGLRATLIPHNEKEVWGTIMTLSPNELHKLYSAPSVNDYHPVIVNCNLQNNLAVKAEIYILDPSIPLAPPKNATYAKELLKICEKLNLPKSYRQEIAALILKIEG